MLKVPFSRISKLGTRLTYSIRTITNKELTELDPVGMDDAVLQEENIAKRKRDLDKKRNKSGLSTGHFNLMHGRPPYSEPQHRSHYTTVYQRKRYGKFGSASNIDPSKIFCIQYLFILYRALSTVAYSLLLYNSINERSFIT